MTGLAISSNFVNVGDLRLHYYEAGSGPALIFLHGGGPGSSGLSNYRRNIESFADRYRVIALDLPGYGQSTKLRIREPLWGFMAKAVAGLIDALALGKVNLVGNSLGGATTLKTALDYPDKVAKFVLMGPAGGYATLTASPTEGIMNLLTFYEGAGPSMERLKSFIRFLVFDPSQITDEVLEERLAAASDPETAQNMPLRLRADMPPIEDLWRERLDRLPHEALIIWGREDRVNPLDQGMILMRQIPNARLYVMPKCGHWAQWEKADEFNRVVGDFLKDDGETCS
jgi:4,5:9,10-diseco-3-hydroxy-5,9,17-trioxoandrosta-1(10),2-diene-4-oate hydrolase